MHNNKKALINRQLHAALTDFMSIEVYHTESKGVNIVKASLS